MRAGMRWQRGVIYALGIGLLFAGWLRFVSNQSMVSAVLGGSSVVLVYLTAWWWLLPYQNDQGLTLGLPPKHGTIPYGAQLRSDGSMPVDRRACSAPFLAMIKTSLRSGDHIASASHRPLGLHSNPRMVGWVRPALEATSDSVPVCGSRRCTSVIW